MDPRPAPSVALQAHALAALLGALLDTEDPSLRAQVQAAAYLGALVDRQPDFPPLVAAVTGVVPRLVRAASAPTAQPAYLDYCRDALSRLDDRAAAKPQALAPLIAQLSPSAVAFAQVRGCGALLRGGWHTCHGHGSGARLAPTQRMPRAAPHRRPPSPLQETCDAALRAAASADPDEARRLPLLVAITRMLALVAAPATPRDCDGGGSSGGGHVRMGLEAQTKASKQALEPATAPSSSGKRRRSADACGRRRRCSRA